MGLLSQQSRPSSAMHKGGLQLWKMYGNIWPLVSRAAACLLECAQPALHWCFLHCSLGRTSASCTEHPPRVPLCACVADARAPPIIRLPACVRPQRRMPWRHRQLRRQRRRQPSPRCRPLRPDRLWLWARELQRRRQPLSYVRTGAAQGRAAWRRAMRCVCVKGCLCIWGLQALPQKMGAGLYKLCQPLITKPSRGLPPVKKRSFHRLIQGHGALLCLPRVFPGVESDDHLPPTRACAPILTARFAHRARLHSWWCTSVHAHAVHPLLQGGNTCMPCTRACCVHAHAVHPLLQGGNSDESGAFVVAGRGKLLLLSPRSRKRTPQETQHASNAKQVSTPAIQSR